MKRLSKFAVTSCALLMVFSSCEREKVEVAPAATDPVPADSEEPVEISRGDTLIITYRRDQPGAELTVFMTSFSGIANATVTSGVGDDSIERSMSLPSADFNKLFDALVKIQALADAKLGDESPAVESKNHHVIMRMDKERAERGVYAFPFGQESEAFKAWHESMMRMLSEE